MSSLFGTKDGLASGIYAQVLEYLRQNPPVWVPPAGPENRLFIFDGDSKNAQAQGGTGWPEVIKTMSAFKGGQFLHAAVAGRDMAATLAAYDANVKPAILAGLAAGRQVFLFIQAGSNDYGVHTLAALRDPFALYVARAIGDGATVVPMTCTRRLDWRGFESVRQAFNEYILSLGLQYTILTDRVFTDPQFAIENPQTEDGIHENAPTRRKVAVTVNAVIEAGGSKFYDQAPEVRRPLVAGRIPYVNYSGQLDTDDGQVVDLCTNATKDLMQTYTNPFSQAGKTGVRYGIKAEYAPDGVTVIRRAITFEIATIGVTSNYHPLLAESLVVFDIEYNDPAIAINRYRRTLLGNWKMRRIGVAGVDETPAGMPGFYPAANDTPGIFGQICVNANGTKIAIYCGDGVAHKWAVSAATNVV
ncbi:hypothetical protein [Janthinobacterium tructae]